MSDIWMSLRPIQRAQMQVAAGRLADRIERSAEPENAEEREVWLGMRGFAARYLGSIEDLLSQYIPEILGFTEDGTPLLSLGSDFCIKYNDVENTVRDATEADFLHVLTLFVRRRVEAV